MKTDRDKLTIKNKAKKEDKNVKRGRRGMSSQEKAYYTDFAKAASTPAFKALQKMVDSKRKAAKKVAESKGLKGKKATEFVNTQIQLLFKQKDFKALNAKSDIKYTGQIID
tara:strand:- start:41 stop:373 length:333 start_codon:yes stop_codon:yes gene_type:complete